MCGIAGFWGNYSKAERESAQSALVRSLAHRGPDGSGTYADDSISLIHTRLSIIDLSEQGNQPLFNEDKSLVLICNGEIYNYKVLRTELIATGHTFASGSDSEVILHLYEDFCRNASAPELGFEKLLHKLTGMFAFALWDKNLKKLFIARDRLGIKPLYYYHGQGCLAFASEVKALAQSGMFTATIDPTSLYEYFLLGIIPGPNTLYKEVKCLPPGFFAAYNGSSFQPLEYWDIPLETKKWRNAGEAGKYLEDLLHLVIEDHLVADVPVGSFLSAGVDSSLITAIAAKCHPGIQTFTASFPGEPEDEGVVAAETAKKLGTSHHSFAIKNDFFLDYESQVGKMDQPFAPNSALSLGRISRLARQSVKVVLSGDGGDELFAGYGRYEAPKRPPFLRILPPFSRNTILWFLARATGKKSLEALRQNLKVSPAYAFFVRLAVASQDEVDRLFSDKVRSQIDKDRFLDHLEQLFEKSKHADALSQMLYADVKTILVDEMLTKCDRMTLINGIEGRVPFLDHRVVEAAFSIPSAFKRNGATGKLLLRDILSRLLSPALAYRQKTGFNSPLAEWLEKEPKTREFVKKEGLFASKLPFLEKQEVMNYIEKPEQCNPRLVYALVSLGCYMANFE